MRISFFVVGVATAIIGFSVVDVALAAAYSCEFPDSWDKYSIIVKNDVTSGIKNYYGPILVGGKFTEYGTYNKVVDGNQNCYFGTGTSNNLNMNVNNAQKIVSDDPFRDAGVDFSYYEWLALNLEPLNPNSNDQNANKIIVLDHGGTFDGSYFRGNNAQGSDNGKTLVVFTTEQEIILEDYSGRQFGPSILAPFAHVKLDGDAGYVDGILVAKSFETFGNNQQGLQAHAREYTGSFECSNEEVELQSIPEEVPQPQPQPQEPQPQPETSSSCPTASDPFTVDVYITHKGSNGLGGVELSVLEQQFKDFYNTKSDDVCDPHNRVIESVMIDPDSITMSVVPDGTLNGFRAKYTVNGKCTGCNNGPQSLIDDECVPAEPPEDPACCSNSISRFVFAADFFGDVGFTYPVVKVENVIKPASCPENMNKRVQYDGSLLCY